MSEKFEEYIKDKNKKFVVVNSAEHGLGVLKSITKTNATIFFENIVQLFHSINLFYILFIQNTHFNKTVFP